MKKICFVVHEFGMFKGRGGIASYIYYLCAALIANCKDEYQVHVITPMYDDKCELLNNPNFVLHAIEPRSLEWQGGKILGILKEIRPDWVETSDYEGLCLEAMVARNKGDKDLANTVFMVIHHTSAKECFVWSYSLPFDKACYALQEVHVREVASYFLCNRNIFPSEFLMRYISEHDGVRNNEILRYTYEREYIEKNTLLSKAEKNFDLSYFKGKFVVSYVSRIEGRKNQKYLIDAFIRFIGKTEIDSVLIIAGNSLVNEIYGYDEREKLFFSIPEEKRKYILFYDFVDKEMYDLICAVSNIAVMASVYENFPIAMMEYVYKGIPVMGSKYSGCKDYMSGCEHYTAFNPFDVEDLAEKLRDFATLSDEEQQNISKIQYRNLSTMCSIQNTIPAKLELYNQIWEKWQDEREANHMIDEAHYICCKELNTVSEDTVTVEMLVVLGNFSLDACQEFILNNSYMKETIPESKAILVAAFGIYHRNLMDALSNGSALIIRNITLHKGKTIAQSVANYLKQTKYDYVYFPYFSRDDGISKEERFVELTNLLFEDIYGIKLSGEVDW